jgi:single-stranded-DNA-specific exonuclease
MKKWQISNELKIENPDILEIVKILLDQRGIESQKNKKLFLTPPQPGLLKTTDVGIGKSSLNSAVKRIRKAIDSKESIVIYADYDADGITAGAVMWESLYSLGAKVMPYIPHRVEEGYGLSIKGIEAVHAQYAPTLIVTVDHGITAFEKVKFANFLGIDVIVTDHHVKPEKLPECTIIHTTQMSGSGISWFVANQIMLSYKLKMNPDLLAIAAIGTIADLVPLTGPNRQIAKYGLDALNQTKRVGLTAIIEESGLSTGNLGTYDISHVLAPRLNAMGRLVHAMDALRLLCVKDVSKARALAEILGSTNKERQQLTQDTTIHAMEVLKTETSKKLLFLSDKSYNQGVIGLVAGKLVEEFYRPAIVVARGETISKASGRSISGFNLIESIRLCSDLLVDVGGHPMAAGFTIETKNIEALKIRLEEIAEKELDAEKLNRVLKIDLQIPLASVTIDLLTLLKDFSPYGFGNPEPVFASEVIVSDMRLVGQTGKHLKLKVTDINSGEVLDAIGFGLGEWISKLKVRDKCLVAYTIDLNTWNGHSSLQLKLKDIKN